LNYAHKNQNNFNDIFVPVQLNERIRKQKMAAMDNSYLMKILFADPLPKSYA